jgi:tetratricopeptide (TPR) repeat protein
MGKKCFHPHNNFFFRAASRIINPRKPRKGLILSFVFFTFAVPGPAAPSGVEPQVKRALGCMDLMLYDEAISLFDQALAKDKAQPGLRTKQAYAYYRMNRPEKAVEALNKELEAFPNDFKALILLSFVQYKSGRPDDAERTARIFQDILEKTRKKSSPDKLDTIMRGLFPNAGVPAYILVLLAVERQDIKSARSWLIQAQDYNYFPTDCWIQAVGAEMDQKNWPEALRLCRSEGDITYPEEVKPSPGRPIKPGPAPSDKKKIQLTMTAEIYVLMGMIYEEQGRPAEAIECLKTAAALKPFDADILKNLAIAHINRNEIEEAARLFQRVVKLNPQDFQSQLLLDQAQKKRRRPDDAAKVALSKDFLNERDVRYRYVFEADPDEIANSANVNAVQLIQEGLILDATHWLRMFVEIYENSPTICYNLGQLYNTQGLNAEALKFGLRAVELKQDYRDAYDLVGNVCFKMGDFENSARLYEQAVHLDLKDPLGYFNLGCAYNELGDLANAEKNWLEAARLENAPAAASEATGAETDVLKIAVKVEVEPISSPACQSLAYLYSKQGKKESALAYFKKALEFNPKTPIPYFEIGKLYLEQNEAGKAQDYFKKYLSLGGDEAKVKPLTKKQSTG